MSRRLCAPLRDVPNTLHTTSGLDLDIDLSKAVFPNRCQMPYKAHDFHEQALSGQTSLTLCMETAGHKFAQGTSLPRVSAAGGRVTRYQRLSLG